MKLDGARVLVVGATGELGARLTTELARAGSVLALTGRRADRLAEVMAATNATWSATVDLLDAQACAAAVGSAAEAMGGLDAVVVATGVAAFGPAVDDDDAVVEELFAVNVLGPMGILRAAAPLLPPGSCLVVLTAVLADVPTAGMAAYSASKAALSAFLTAWRRELRRSQITVLDVRPPHLETGLADRALSGTLPRMPAGHDIDELVALVLRGMTDGKSELVADLGAGTISLR